MGNDLGTTSHSYRFIFILKISFKSAPMSIFLLHCSDFAVSQTEDSILNGFDAKAIVNRIVM